MKGSEFCLSIWDLPLGRERNEAIYRAFVTGGGLHRDMAKIQLAGNRGHFWACEDYVSIGDPNDFVRIPMDAPTAQRVLNHLGLLLPSAKMVDMIFTQAFRSSAFDEAVRLTPSPKPPGAEMVSVRYFVEHNKTIEQQRNGRGGLVVGVKKDLVVTNRTIRQPGRVPIYGWPNTSGHNIQPLSLVHEAGYADYSHGVRGILPIVRIDGVDVPLEQAIADPRYSSLLCYQEDSPLRATRLSTDDSRATMTTVPDTERTPATGTVVSVVSESGDVSGIPFVRAANYTPGRSVPVDLVVIHDMEAAETMLTAENVSKFFANQSRGGSGSSAHYNVDCDSIVQSVREKDVAWHAPGANHNGIGVEHAGYARQTMAEWRDPYSDSMLHLSAKLVAGICQRLGIPVEYVDESELMRAVPRARGITTHLAVSRAFKKSTHTDPGPNFPMDYYLGLVRQYSESSGTV